MTDFDETSPVVREARERWGEVLAGYLLPAAWSGPLLFQPGDYPDAGAISTATRNLALEALGSR